MSRLTVYLSFFSEYQEIPFVFKSPKNILDRSLNEIKNRIFIDCPTWVIEKIQFECRIKRPDRPTRIILLSFHETTTEHLTQSFQDLFAEMKINDHLTLSITALHLYEERSFENQIYLVSVLG